MSYNFTDVSKDSVKFIKNNPVKSSIYGTIGASALTFYKTNPTYQDFTDQIRSSQNLIGLVYEDSQNLNSTRYLKFIEQCTNEERIRTTSFALFSIIWIHDYPASLSTTDAQCEYLQPQLSSYFDRIIDFGFLGKWWNIERQMKNYDVNL